MPMVPRRPLYAWLTHPFEICITIALLLTAIPSLSQDWTFSGVIDKNLGAIFSLVWQGGLAVGAALVLYGLFSRPRAARSKPPVDAAEALAKLRSLESAGSVFIATACYVYAFVLRAFGDRNLFVVSTIAMLGLAFTLRVVALAVSDKIELDRLKKLTAEAA